MRRIVLIATLWFTVVGVTATSGAGPDVIVGDLFGTTRWGTVGSITAYSVGTNSCNVGTAPLLWVGSTNQHPVIAQNMYRLAHR